MRLSEEISFDELMVHLCINDLTLCTCKIAIGFNYFASHICFASWKNRAIVRSISSVSWELLQEMQTVRHVYRFHDNQLLELFACLLFQKSLSLCLQVVTLLFCRPFQSSRSLQRGLIVFLRRNSYFL